MRLAKTAKVVGDIVHEVLAIEAGAHIEGQLRRLDEEPKNRNNRDDEPRRKPEAVKLAVGGEKAAG